MYLVTFHQAMLTQIPPGATKSFMQHVQHPLNVVCIFIAYNSNYLCSILQKKKVHDLVFLGVKLLSEMVRGTADVIKRGRERERGDK